MCCNGVDQIKVRIGFSVRLVEPQYLQFVPIHCCIGFKVTTGAYREKYL
jgi:hypothetical protein